MEKKNKAKDKIKKNNKVPFIILGIIVLLFAFVYFIGWPLIQKMILDQACNTYGPTFKAEKCGYKGIKCVNLNNRTEEIKNWDCYDSKEEFEEEWSGAGSAKKPIIYFYPEKETKLTIKLGYPNNITTSYPKYKNGWNIIAKPNGDLIDLDTNRNIYALYWEGINKIEFPTNDGFIVKGEDSSKFLEEKLKILGLNERESEEFIVYWLPILEHNKYNYIRFARLDEINKNMPLYISEEPETLIRVLMIFKALDKPIEIKEQKLDKKERKGFTVVEWGGVNLNENKKNIH